MLSVIIAAAFYKQHSATRGTVQYVGHHAPYTRKHNDLCVPSDHLQADSKLRRGVPVSVVACMSHWRLTAASQILLQDPNGVLIAKVIEVLVDYVEDIDRLFMSRNSAGRKLQIDLCFVSASRWPTCTTASSCYPALPLGRWVIVCMPCAVQ